jgi:hypothetical protein
MRRPSRRCSAVQSTRFEHGAGHHHHRSGPAHGPDRRARDPRRPRQRPKSGRVRPGQSALLPSRHLPVLGRQAGHRGRGHRHLDRGRPGRAWVLRSRRADPGRVRPGQGGCSGPRPRDAPAVRRTTGSGRRTLPCAGPVHQPHHGAHSPHSRLTLAEGGSLARLGNDVGDGI